MAEKETEIVIEHVKELILILGALMVGTGAITSNLRHAYTQLNEGTVKDQKEFANGLIAPAVARLEELVTMLNKAVDQYHAVIRDSAEGDTRH